MWVETAETIVAAGEVGDRFYVILSGEVDVVPLAGGRRTLTAGDSFGEIALVQDILGPTVTAIARTELLALDRGAFLEALTGQPRSRAIAHAVSRRRLVADAAVEAGGLETRERASERAAGLTPACDARSPERFLDHFDDDLRVGHHRHL